MAYRLQDNRIDWIRKFNINNEVMKAEELRIGNYVWEDYGGQYLVIGISETKVRVSKTKTTIDVNYKITEIHPILLTEEWLLKFGFEKGSDIMGECYFIENATYDLDFAIHVVDRFFIYNNTRLYIHYVHDLQNLFYSLHFFELECNTK